MSGLVTERADAQGALSQLHNNAFFLRAVSAMAERQEVLAACAIDSACGMTLFQQGQRVGGDFYHQLAPYHLATAVDDQLQLRSIVDIPALEVQVHVLSGCTSLGRLLQQAMGDKHYMLLEVLRHMHWPPRAGFKMTVM